MNRTLIDALDAINNFLAICFVIAGGAVGYFMAPGPTAGTILAAIGAFGGLVAAVLVCGLLATIIEIERHLRILVRRGEP